MNKLTIINIIGIAIAMAMIFITYKKERLSELSKTQKKLGRIRDILLYSEFMILGMMFICIIIRIGGTSWLYL